MVSKADNRSSFRRRWRVLAVLAFFVILNLAWDLDHSASELAALRWHRQHGQSIIANGITFPLYYWHVPKESDDFGFGIEDHPGPLRPGDDGFAFIEVNRPEKDHPRGKLTAGEMVTNQVQNYRNSNYPESVTFNVTVAGQSMPCMSNAQMGGTTIYCYGDGPIVHLFFTGGESELAHFNQMIAGAKKLK